MQLGKILGARGLTTTPVVERAYHVRRVAKVVCGFACLILLVCACAEYAQVSGRIDAKVMYNSGNVIHDSLVIFAGVVIAGLGVMLAVED